ncbi:MAG: 2-C-methyl-D-erythritol 2,4-cyclodiphosphate synthase [Clostridia bacterium]|nr:2-C-methyl-D-erythritol 2,4-cyclodiphosphate synthase [Clostridia bacterium]
MTDKISAIICAAGKGERAAFGKNKLLAHLHGAPALYHTLKKFDIPEIDEVIVTSSEFDFKEISALCAPFGYKVVLGGETRTKSVVNALKEVTGDIVLIHDGARPYVSEKLILDCIESVKTYGSGICALNATDTAVYSSYGVITERLDRNSLYLVQTPQGFITEDIKNAYALAGDTVYTDDSAVYGQYIAPPRIIDGERQNIKLTYKDDFAAPLPFVFKTENSGQVGFGVDVHAFGDGKHITLAGVKIECDKCLIAHSDGDVAIHALMDALLSATGLNDIGHYFPDTDKKYKGADSGKLLKEVIKLIKGAGFRPANISLSIQAQTPRLSPYIDQMIKRLAELTGVAQENIAISAGTCEGLGFVGENLGICAYAAVSIKKV